MMNCWVRLETISSTVVQAMIDWMEVLATTLLKVVRAMTPFMVVMAMTRFTVELAMTHCLATLAMM